MVYTIHGHTWTTEKLVNNIDEFSAVNKPTVTGQDKALNLIVSYNASPATKAHYNSAEVFADAAGKPLADLTSTFGEAGISKQYARCHSQGSVVVLSSVSHGARLNGAFAYQPAVPRKDIKKNTKYDKGLESNPYFKLFVYTTSSSDHVLTVPQTIANLSRALGKGDHGGNGPVTNTPISSKFCYDPTISKQVTGHSKYKDLKTGKVNEVFQSKVMDDGLEVIQRSLGDK